MQISTNAHAPLSLVICPWGRAGKRCGELFLKAPGSRDGGGMPCGIFGVARWALPWCCLGEAPGRAALQPGPAVIQQIIWTQGGRDGGGKEEEPQALISFFKALALWLEGAMAPRGDLWPVESCVPLPLPTMGPTAGHHSRPLGNPHRGSHPLLFSRDRGICTA